MTSKDYTLVAEVIQNLKLDITTRLVVAEAFIKRLQASNPRFKPHLFLRACNLPEGE